MIINNKYKLESDELNVTLYQKRTNRKSGVELWTAIAHFSSPENALKYLVDLEVMGDGMKDLKTIIKKQGELCDLIKHLQPLSLTPEDRQGRA